MFNLFSKKEEPEDNTPSEEEKEKIVQKYREQMKKENHLYSRILSKDENLVCALKLIVHRLDLINATDSRSSLDPLQKLLEEMFPEPHD